MKTTPNAPAMLFGRQVEDDDHLIDALARHPTTADRLARELYAFFVEEVHLRDGGAWTGSDAQVSTKTAGLARLLIGSSEYQFS